MTRALCNLAMAASAAAAMLAACVPTLPGELDPGATGVAGSGGGEITGPGGATGAGAVSGAAGVSATGGSRWPTGAGGAGPPPLCQPLCTPVIGCGGQPPSAPGSISTFETGCSSVDPIDGRDGGWFVWASGTSVVSPDPAQPFQVSCLGAAGSCFSACISGTLSGTGYPSAILGVTLRDGARAYDVTRYDSVVFSVFGNIGPSSALHFKVPLAADTMAGNGDGTCTTGCFDAYGSLLSGSGPDGSWSWDRRELRFKDLRQAGWGVPEPWDSTAVISLQWMISATSETVAGDPFMICVDQVGLVAR